MRWSAFVALSLVLAVGAVASLGAADLPSTTAFTYQGELKQAGGLVSGTFDFQFLLYDQPTEGTLLGTTALPGVEVKDGAFTAQLDFGLALPASGEQRFLETHVRPVGSGDFTNLNPRQPLKSRTDCTVDGNLTVAGHVASGTLLVGDNPTQGGNELIATGTSTSSGTHYISMTGSTDDATMGLVLKWPHYTARIQSYQGTVMVPRAAGWVPPYGTFSVGDIVNPDFVVMTNGTTKTKVLQITGGSDIAEPFDVSAPSGVEPGLLVAIDPERPGQLKVADRAYDPAVVGVISGANGLSPGLILKQDGSTADGAHPVALSGRVYCWADASHGAIEPGDQLTTSGTPGHAMKATSHRKAHGAVIGKAMSGLETGTGLVLVLVQPS